MNYEYADKVIRDMNKRNLRAFDRIKTLKFDELNVFRTVKSIYEASIELAKKRYRQIAWDAYIEALLLCGISRKEAEEKAEDTITDDWILDMLEEYNALTLYSFLTEAERKEERAAEAVLAAQDKAFEVDKALRFWTLQVIQYAEFSVLDATMQGYKDAGVKKVRWEAEDDDRVCSVCIKRNGKIYPIDKVPPIPHWRCRCLIWPVQDGTS